MITVVSMGDVDMLKCVSHTTTYNYPFLPHRHPGGCSMPMRVRSMVGLIPLFACLVLEDRVVQKLSGFRKRLVWFLENRKDLSKQVCGSCIELGGGGGGGGKKERFGWRMVSDSRGSLLVRQFPPPPTAQISYVDTVNTGGFFHLLAIPSKDKLLRVLKYLLDEDEFLSPYGIRSLSKVGSIATVMITIVGRQYSDHVFV